MLKLQQIKTHRRDSCIGLILVIAWKTIGGEGKGRSVDRGKYKTQTTRLYDALQFINTDNCQHTSH